MNKKVEIFEINKPKYLNDEKAMMKARKIADNQSTFLWENGEYPKDAIKFEYQGISVLNPFWDESCRWELSNEDAYLYYGITNMDGFIEKVLKR